jgi:hypothetical protein
MKKDEYAEENKKWFDWHDSPKFDIEFWLDYNGYWEPESIFIANVGLAPGLFPSEVVEEIEYVAKCDPRIFFSIHEPELATATRIRLTGVLATKRGKDTPFDDEHKFKRSLLKVLERHRLVAIG